MNIFKIDADIRALIDEDTGEIQDFDKLEELMKQRGDAVENMALLYKEYVAQAGDIETEVDNLTARKKQAEANADRIKCYLATTLNAQKYETPRVKIGFRSSTSVSIENEPKFIEWAKINHDDYLRYKEPSISLTLISKDLKDGKTVPGASLTTKQNIQIK